MVNVGFGPFMSIDTTGSLLMGWMAPAPTSVVMRYAADVANSK
ncbi:MAG: hypothetical protein ACJAWC_003054 [Yoonia sp.]|jgi:hypothetical protein